jgi:hypothetical protein
MLFLLLCWAVLLAVARVIGATVLQWTSPAEDYPDRADERFFAQIWVGLFSLASILLCVSFFHPLSASVLACLPIAAVCFAVPSVRRQVRRSGLSPMQRGGFGIVLLAVAWNVTGPVELYDTGLYHAQMIQWLSRFGTPPGLALLHFRFGFSSSWFALAAVFQAVPFPDRTMTVINGLALALAVLQVTIAFSRILSRSAANPDLYISAALPLALLIGFAARFQLSPSPNFPVSLGIVLTGWAMVTRGSGGKHDWNLPLLLAAGTVGVKITAIPLLLLAAIFRLTGRQPRGRLAQTALIAIVLASPVLVANRIASGCPLFPSTFLCAGGAATVPLARIYQIEKFHVRPYTGDSRFGSLFDLRRNLKWAGKPLNALLAGVALIATLLVWILRATSPVYWTGVFGFAALFLSAPDFRFLAGFSAILLGVLAQTLHLKYARPRRESRHPHAVLLALAVAAGALVLADAAVREATYRVRTHDAFRSLNLERLLVPAHLPDAVPGSAFAHSLGVIYRTPKVDQCWSLPLPCTPAPPPPNLVWCAGPAHPHLGFCLAPTGPASSPVTAAPPAHPLK